MSVLVSAHRGGAEEADLPEASLAAYRRAVELGCDHVEVDVRTAVDGTPVVRHDPLVEGDVHVTLDAVLALVAGRCGLHLDLKDATGEVGVVERVLAVLDPRDVVVTTAEDASVPRLRAWADAHAPDLLVGLSTAPPAHDGRLLTRARLRCLSWFPRTRMRRSGADVVVAHHLVARWWLRSWARRQGLPLLVWTVDDADDLERWTDDPHTWMVATNRPALALRLRRR